MRATRRAGDQDVPLTELGRRQAELTGHALQTTFGRFDCVYHSGYRRTEVTAEGLLQD